MARDLSTYNRVTSVAPDVNNNLLGNAISSIAEMSVNVIRQEEASNMNRLYSDMQLEINELDHKIKVDYESNPQMAQEKYKEHFATIVDRYGSNVSSNFIRDWEGNVSKLKTNNLLQLQNWGFKQGQINTKRNIATSLDNIYKVATSQGMSYGLGDGDDLDVLLGADASLSPLINMSSKMLGEETTKQMFEGVSDGYIKSFISGVAETNPIKAMELLSNEEVAGRMDAGHRSKMQGAIKNKVMNYHKEMKEQEVFNAILFNTELMKPMNYAQLQKAFDASPDMSDNAREFFLKRNGFSNLGEQGLAYTDLRSKVAETGLTDDLKKQIIEAGNIGNLTKAEVKGLLGKAESGDKMLQAEKIKQGIDVRGRIGKSSDMNAVELKKLQEDIYRASSTGALRKDDAEYYLGRVLPRIANTRKEDVRSEEGGIADDIFKRVDNYYRHNSSKNKSGDEGIRLYNAKMKMELYDLLEGNLKSEIETLNNPDVQTYGDLRRLGTRDRNDIIKRASRKAVNDYAIGKAPQIEDMSVTPTKIKVEGQLINTGVEEKELIFNSVEEALSANLQKGTIVIIGGRRAVIK